MSESFLGEIRLFAGTYAPYQWAFCDGSILSISQNTGLFALLGTQYGGNGTTTFALPDLRNRVPIHYGQGPGLSDRFIGETGGAASFTMISAEMPAHTHSVTGNSTPATVAVPPPGGRFANASGGRGQQGPVMYAGNTPNTQLSSAAISIAGGGTPINLVKPVLAINYIISLAGVTPPRP